MIFFKVLFYGFGLFLAFIELFQFKLAGSLSEKMREWSDFTKMKKDQGEEVKWDDVPKDIKGQVLFKTVLSICQLIWMCIGLFTFNWVIFASYWIFIWLINNIFNNSRPSTALYATKSVLFILFALFVALNSFHLQIDVLSLF